VDAQGVLDLGNEPGYGVLVVRHARPRWYMASRLA
jgi:hypothetical protein